MRKSSIKADREILYGFIDQAISDAKRHLETARWKINTETCFEDAIDRCLRAFDALGEAEKKIALSSSFVTARKKSIFDRKIVDLYRELWCATKDLSKKTRLCYDEHRQTRVLRMYFLAHCYDPQDEAEAVGG